MNAMIVLEDMCPDLKVAAGKWAAEAIMINYLIERESYAIKKTPAEAEAVAADSESDSDAKVADIRPSPLSIRIIGDKKKKGLKFRSSPYNLKGRVKWNHPSARPFLFHKFFDQKMAV